jgi:hypothetical protein
MEIITFATWSALQGIKERIIVFALSAIGSASQGVKSKELDGIFRYFNTDPLLGGIPFGLVRKEG